MSDKYQFTKGAHFPKGVTPDVVGTTLNRIASKHGEIRPDLLVVAAREPNHPLHSCFEWDNGEAAHKYRLQQAAYVIRHVTIVREESPDITIRAFVNTERNGAYRSLEVVLADPDSRAQLLAQALSDLQAFERKYAALSELSDVRDAIGAFIASATSISKAA